MRDDAPFNRARSVGDGLFVPSLVLDISRLALRVAKSHGGLG